MFLPNERKKDSKTEILRQLFEKYSQLMYYTAFDILHESFLAEDSVHAACSKLAKSIMENPDLVILDEPMNGLDNHGVDDFRALFLKLKENGKTILLASHNREDIQQLCDSVYEMDAGILTQVR